MEYLPLLLIAANVFRVIMTSEMDAQYSLSLYKRQLNELILVCNVSGGIELENITFWINKTEKIDILRDLPTGNQAVKIGLNMISFQLQPQYEGTFYCGINSTDNCIGVGPIAANPEYLIDGSDRVYYAKINTERNVTLTCPIKLGALMSSYNVSWYTQDNTTLANSEKYKIEVIDSFSRPDVHLNNVQPYYCNVTVRNPLDSEIWNHQQAVIIYTDLSHLVTPAVLAGVITSIMVILACPVMLCYIYSKVVKTSQQKNCTGTAVESPTQAIVDISVGKIRRKPATYSDLSINKLKENIGNGAFGSVFRATYKGFPCAAKLLTHHAQQMATGGAFRAAARIQISALERFNRECDFLKTLEHRNIVQHIATLSEPESGLPILVMELMDCSLKQYLEDKQDKKLSRFYQMSLCLDLSKGLAFLHEHNICHRDLCDDNVLLDLSGGETPTAKIGDFGMSRILPPDYMNSTLSGLCHRQVYLPPETREEPYDYNNSIDVYSFGVIAIQIIHVKTQLSGKGLATLYREIPQRHFLKAIIRSCISSDPGSRPQAADIVHEINQEDSL